MKRGKILSVLQRCSETRLEQDKPNKTSTAQDSVVLSLRSGQGHEGNKVENQCETSSSSWEDQQSSKSPQNRSSLKPIREEVIFSDWDSWDPMSEDYHSVRNTLALNPDKDPECVITGQTMPTSAGFGKISICSHYEKYGTCADGKYCDRAHVKASNRERVLALQRHYETNKGRTCLTGHDLSPIELEVDPKLTLLVVVTSTKWPNSFYVVAPYDNLNFSNYTRDDIKFYIERINQSSSVKTKLDKSHEQLSAIYDHNYRVDNINDNIYVSQIVACKLKDGRFHRALVTEKNDDFEDKFNYKLFLIDIGVEVELPRESIFDIRAHSLINPPMAIHCKLNVKPSRNELKWSGQALEYFETHLGDKRHWLCKLIDHVKEDSIFVVDLFDIESRKSFTDRLVQTGLADYVRIRSGD